MPIHRSLGGTPALLVLLALGATVHVQAQVFKSTVEVVPLTVTVTDAKGQYVKNLVETDFAVLEEGVRQSLAFFANEPVPIDLALTIDASASMASQLPIVRKAAGALVDSLRGGDRATVVTIRNAVGVALPLTADRPRIDAAIRDLSASGGTALYDGVYVVLKELERARMAEIRRRVLGPAVGRARYVQPPERRRHARAGAASRRRDLCHRHADFVCISRATGKTDPRCRRRMRCALWRATLGPDRSSRRGLRSCRPFTAKSPRSSRTSTSSGIFRHGQTLEEASNV